MAAIGKPLTAIWGGGAAAGGGSAAAAAGGGSGGNGAAMAVVGRLAGAAMTGRGLVTVRGRLFAPAAGGAAAAAGGAAAAEQAKATEMEGQLQSLIKGHATQGE